MAMERRPSLRGRARRPGLNRKRVFKANQRKQTKVNRRKQVKKRRRRG